MILFRWRVAGREYAGQALALLDPKDITKKILNLRQLKNFAIVDNERVSSLTHLPLYVQVFVIPKWT